MEHRFQYFPLDFLEEARSKVLDVAWVAIEWFKWQNEANEPISRKELMKQIKIHIYSQEERDCFDYDYKLLWRSDLGDIEFLVRDGAFIDQKTRKGEDLTVLIRNAIEELESNSEN